MNAIQKHIEEANKQLAKRSFYHFFKEFWNTVESQELEDNWHIKFLCDKLQEVVERVERGEKKEGNVVINISPGSSKSSIASVMLPAWIWTRTPSMKVISGSHAQSLSLQLNTKSRDVIKSDKYQRWFPNVSLKDDDNQKSNFSTTENGQRTATSTGSSIIGRHGDIIIVDDIIPTSATENDIDKANDWLTQELNTRKTKKEVTPIILIMQRLAHDDPSATLLKDPNTIHISLPAEVTEANESQVRPAEAINNYTKEGDTLYMDMNRLSPSILKDMKQTLGSRGYASQFLQSPDPIDGGIIKKDWIKVQTWNSVQGDKLNKIAPQFYVDTAYTENRDNDPSAILTVKAVDNQLYVLNGEQFWLEFPQLVKKITNYVHREGYTNKSKVYIEGKASGKSLIQQLKTDTTLNVIEDDTLKKLKGGKDQRLESISPILESGRVIFIDGSWNEELTNQITSNNPIHYDMRDVLIMAVQGELLQKKTGSGKYNYVRG